MLVNVVRSGASSLSAFSKILVFAVPVAVAYSCSHTQGGAIGTGGQASVVSAAGAGVQPPPGNVVAAGTASVIVIHGRIASVDQRDKLVTLQAVNGKQVILHVYNPYNLAAAKPGEPFAARFYEIATVQNLPPEQSPPAQSLRAGIVSAVPGQTPSAAFA